ncbi:MAG: pitrilysin family protein [Gemmatimonadota bacterium]
MSAPLLPRPVNFSLSLIFPLLLGFQTAAPNPQATCGPGISGSSSLRMEDESELPVQRFILPSGMRFLILPREGAPTVSFVVHYPVGSMQEVPGSTGLAHLVEHMLFKGSSTIGARKPWEEAQLFAQMDAAQDSLLEERGRTSRANPVRVLELQERIRSLEGEARSLAESGEFDAILSRNGARNLNATTSHEATTYYVELPANRAELWFALEADRLRDPVFRDFYSERDVVMEERRARVESSPGGLLNEAYLAAAFPVHPYGLPVVGLMNDLELLTRGQVENFYQTHYGPDQAVVAVVGQVEPDSIQAWAHRYFHDLGRRPPPPPKLVEEPHQRGRRSVEVSFDAEPQLRMGWKIPPESHPDTPALVMLSAILSGGRTSQLHSTLVLEERTATSVGASLGPGSRHTRLFTVGATPRLPHTPADVMAGVKQVLDKVRSEPVSVTEVERVRLQLEASRVRRLQSNFGLALQLAESEGSQGDWQETFRFTDRLVAVTPEEIQAVARRYLREETLTVAILRRPQEPRTP